MKPVIVLMSLLFVLSACSKSQVKEDTFVKLEGKDLQFSLYDTQDELHTLADLKGKPVVIKFWASWCPICLAGMDEIEYLSELEDKGYEIITVVSPGLKGEQSDEDFVKWFATRKLNNTVVLRDSEGVLVRELAIRAYPTYIFIDAKGSWFETQLGHIDQASIETILNEFNEGG